MQVSDASNPPHETPEELRARLLRCPKVRASVRKVARSQGVVRHEEEDVSQETLLRVSQATLPQTEAEARKYINGIAKFVAINHFRKRAEEPTESLEGIRGEERPVPERIEQRVFMRGVFEQGYKKFGKSFEWFMRAKVHKETAEDIAAAAGLAPGHVRKELSLVSRWFDGAWGKRTGIGSVLALVLAVSAGWWLTHREATVDESQFATYAAVKTQEVRATDAHALRERGQKACAEGAWSACEHDLAAAAEMDPQGETPELWGMKERAIGRQFYLDANPAPDEDNAKPGR
jgi:DNA-directed RNA polymerase specialized sigma24 family protein